MDNNEVIQQLRSILAQLEKRRQELQQLQNNPGGPLAERMTRQAQVYERLSSINVRIYNLQIRLHEREYALQLAKAVPPLDPARAAAVRAALAAVSKTIQITGDFQTAIALATAISDAASNAHTSVA